MTRRQNDIQKVLYYKLATVPLILDHDAGVETNIARTLIQLSETMATFTYQEKLTWILDQIPNTRIDIEVTPYHDAVTCTAVFLDETDATAFRLRWC